MISQSAFLAQVRKDNIDMEKLQAIIATERPLLVTAGAGSVKTKTLVERIVYLVLKYVAPENIFAATFIEKAAKELMTQVSSRLLNFDIRRNLNEMYIGTLRFIFLRLLEEFREYTRIKRNYRILDQFEQQYLLFRKMNTYLEVEDTTDFLAGHVCQQNSLPSGKS